MAEGDLIDYFGTECVHCKQMEPTVQRVEKELGVKLIRKEVWHNSENQKEFMKVAEGKCNGVPFYYNKASGKFICGATSYEKFKEWAEGK